MNIVALAGGVGGAKLVDGLSKILASNELSVIVNTGDDFFHLGLFISPDLDSICYTLAGVASITTGWGIERDTATALEKIDQMDGPNWFNLGDVDIATHIFRTERTLHDIPLSTVTTDLCKHLGIEICILPMTDNYVPTIVQTVEENDLGFQEYFVKYHCQPTVKGFIFQNHEKACPVSEAINSLNKADLVIFCPSNPWVSLDPILSIPGYREIIKSKKVIGVSPIIGGRTIKGPAAKMFEDLGNKPDAAAVARHYQDLLKGFLIDIADTCISDEISHCGIIPKVTNIVMRSSKDRKHLAEEILTFGMQF